MKMMFQTLAATTEDMVDIFRMHSKMGAPVDIREILARFTTDSIVSCAFGLESKSLKDDNAPFRVYGRKIFATQDFRQRMIYLVPQYLLYKFKVKIMNPEVEEFIIDVVKKNIEYRETNNVIRKDFFHLLLQLKNRNDIFDDNKLFNEDGKVRHYLTLHEMAAQCYVFFGAGFETSATTMTCALYELAQNQEVQEKLRQEMKKILKENDGIMTYDAIMKMEYLDKVVNGR